MLSRRRLLRALALSPLAGTACKKPPELAPRWEFPDSPVKVITSTVQAADLARVIGGRAVDVASLIPPGGNPHLWRPSAADVAEMRMADVAVLNGLGLEAELKETAANLRAQGVIVAVLGDVVPAEKRLPLLTDTTRSDPHFWMNPALWSLASESLEAALQEAAPGAKEYFSKRAHAYRVDLQELNTWTAKLFDEVSDVNRAAVTSHPSLAYLADAYRLEFRSSLTLKGEPAPDAAAELTEWIKGRRLKHLFREPGVDLPALTTLCLPLGVKPDQRIFSLSFGADGEVLPGTSDEFPLDNYLGSFRYTVDCLQSRMALR